MIFKQRTGFRQLQKHQEGCLNVNAAAQKGWCLAAALVPLLSWAYDSVSPICSIVVNIFHGLSQCLQKCLPSKNRKNTLSSLYGFQKLYLLNWKKKKKKLMEEWWTSPKTNHICYLQMCVVFFFLYWFLNSACKKIYVYKYIHIFFSFFLKLNSGAGL